MRVRFEGVDFDMVESPLLGEVIWAEKQIGSGIDDWTVTERGMVTVLLSLRRANVMLTVKDVLLLPADAFQMLLDEDVAAEGDPQRAEEAPEADTAPGPGLEG